MPRSLHSRIVPARPYAASEARPANQVHAARLVTAPSGRRTGRGGVMNGAREKTSPIRRPTGIANGPTNIVSDSIEYRVTARVAANTSRSPQGHRRPAHMPRACRCPRHFVATGKLNDTPVFTGVCVVVGHN